MQSVSPRWLQPGPRKMPPLVLSPKEAVAAHVGTSLVGDMWGQLYQRRSTVNVGRLVVTGLVASVLFLVLDMALGMAGGWIGKKLFGVPSTQPAGIDAKIKFGLVFELINGFLLALIYALIHTGLPGRGWLKGVSYGLIVWVLRVVMWAFSTYMESVSQTVPLRCRLAYPRS